MTQSKKPPVQIKKFTVGQMQENCYVVIDSPSSEAVIIDPGDDASYLVEQINKLEAKPIAILATHGHFDHILAAFELQMIYKIPFCMNPDDQFLLDRMSETAQHFLGHGVIELPPKITKPLFEGDKIMFGSNILEVVTTLGHTPGSLSFRFAKESCVFVGDLIFADGSVGRTDFSYSDKRKLGSSIARILTLSDNTVLYAGHGAETTVLNEKAYHV